MLQLPSPLCRVALLLLVVLGPFFLLLVLGSSLIAHVRGVCTGSASPLSFPPSYPRCCVTSSASLCPLLCVVSPLLSFAFPTLCMFVVSPHRFLIVSAFLLLIWVVQGLHCVEGRPWGRTCCRWTIRVVVGWFLLPHRRFLPLRSHVAPHLCGPSSSLLRGLVWSWLLGQRH